MVKDLQFAIRTLAQQPGFTAVVIITLALGIGANTAIFSVVNAVLLQPLPFPEPEQLYFVRTAMTDGRPTSGTVSALQLTALNNEARTVRHASGSYLYELSLLPPDGNAVKTASQAVLGGFFEVLGVEMALGRAPTEEEHVPGTASDTAVVSYRLWRDVLGSDPEVIGSRIRLDSAEGGAMTVVGVAPPEFDFPRGTDVWFALRFPPDNPGHFLDAYVRVEHGTALAQVRAEGAVIMAALGEENPQYNLNREFVFEPLLDAVVGDMSQTVLILLGATGILLLIASINVTSLLLSRGAGRAREIALRVAIGASRLRIVRQLLTESVLLALLGAALGLGLAVAGVRFLLLVGPADLPRLDSVPIDGRVLGFTLVTTLFVALLMGFAPALRLARTDLRSLVNEGGRGGSAGPGRGGIFGALVVAEVGMAVLLVIGAGLLVRSFFNMIDTDRGFNPEHKLVFELALPQSTFPPSSEDYSGVAAFYTELIARVQQMNRVRSVTAASSLPVGLELDVVTSFPIVGQLASDGTERLRARIRQVGPAFFSTLDIPLVAGRELTALDRRDTRGVAVVNEEFARRYFPDQDPLGQLIDSTLGVGPFAEMAMDELEIVGVAGAIRTGSLQDEPEPILYVAFEQAPARRMTLIVDTDGDPRTLIPAIREQISSMDRMLPVEFQLYTNLVAASLSRERLGMMLLVVFGAVALLLAAVGIYGVMAHSVTQRSGEIAVRSAMGATAMQVLQLIMQRGLLLTLIGIAFGISGAVALRQVVASQLYGMSALDFRVFVSVPIMLLFVALLATFLPARRAMQIDPAVTLRTD